MKKNIALILIIFSIILLAMVAIPVVFKKPLLEKTKTTLNNQVNAQVN